MVFGFGKKKKVSPPPAARHKTAVLPFSHGVIRMASLNDANITYDSIVKEGFQGNPIAFRCIDMIKTCVASINIDVMQRGRDGKVVKIEAGPLNDLMARPNPFLSWGDFISQFITYYYTAGAAFMVRNPESGTIKELFLLRPDLVELERNKAGQLIGYWYAKGTEFARRFPVDFVTGRSPVMAMMNFDPIHPDSAFSFFSPAAQGVDSHNAISRWNTNLVLNGARPSGALKYSGPDGDANLGEDQFNRLKEQLAEHNSGPVNSGKPLLLEGSFEWLEMQINPKDMDYQNSKNSASTDICTAFGVPPQLIGVPGSQTYANYAEARLAFWENTVLPLADRILKCLNQWLIPQIMKAGARVELGYDMNEIPALADKRKQTFSMVEASTFLTVNEKRNLCGFDDIDGGDVLYVDMGKSPINAPDPVIDPDQLRDALARDGMKPATAKRLSRIIFNAEGETNEAPDRNKP